MLLAHELFDLISANIRSPEQPCTSDSITCEISTLQEGTIEGVSENGGDIERFQLRELFECRDRTLLAKLDIATSETVTDVHAVAPPGGEVRLYILGMLGNSYVTRGLRPMR